MRENEDAGCGSRQPGQSRGTDTTDHVPGAVVIHCIGDCAGEYPGGSGKHIATLPVLVKVMRKCDGKTGVTDCHCLPCAPTRLLPRNPCLQQQYQRRVKIQDHALDHARRVIAEATQLTQALEGLAGQQRVRVRLAANTVANSTFLPPALGPFLNDYPEVDLQVEERPSQEILQAVQAGEIDIGVLDGNLPMQGIVSLPFRHDRLVLFVPEYHTLAARGHCLFREALNFPFVGMPPERAMQRFVEEMATLLGKPLTVRVRAPSFFAIAQLVAQKVGLAVLPEAAAQRHRESLAATIVALDDPWATRELRLCVHDLDGLSAQARQLVAYLTGANSS